MYVLADIVVHIRGVEDFYGVTYNRRRIPHSRRCVFFKQAVPVMDAGKLLSCGDHAYHFYLPLPPKLPGSFEISGYHVGRIGVLYDVSASVSYTLSVKVRAKGAFVADLVADTELHVLPRSPPLRLRAMSESVSKRVRYLGLFPRGRCHLSVLIDRNMLEAGSPLYVTYSVNNESRMAVSSVSIRLVEDISVKPIVIDCVTKSSSSSVCKRTHAGLMSGERRDSVARLDLVYDSTGQPIRRTTKARFTRWNYRLVMRCHFALSPSVRVELPVVIV